MNWVPESKFDGIMACSCSKPGILHTLLPTKTDSVTKEDKLSMLGYKRRSRDFSQIEDLAKT